MALLLLCAPPAQARSVTPWGAVYELVRDERSLSDISIDKAIATEIKAALLEKNGKLGLAVKTYCYLGKVVLLGQLADDSFKSFAVATARKTPGVKGVTTHWVPPSRRGSTISDLEIAAKLRAELVEDKDISATQVEAEVFSGHVFLLGMVRSQKDAAKAAAHAKSVSGVKSVTSLLVPHKK
jgi:hyperosmotically inducible protein